MQVERTYTGPQSGDIVDHMKACNPRGPLVIAIAKLFPKTDVSAFDALGRILSGTVKRGDRVRVLGEAYTPEDEEDSAVAEVTKVWVYQARYRIPLTKALAGAPPEHTPIRMFVLVKTLSGATSEGMHVHARLVNCLDQWFAKCFSCCVQWHQHATTREMMPPSCQFPLPAIVQGQLLASSS